MPHNENMDVFVGKDAEHEEHQNASKNGFYRNIRNKDNEEIEKKLRESEERYRSLGATTAAHVNQLETVFASMVDGVFVYDREGNLLQTNDAVRELLALDAHPNYANRSLDKRLRLIEIRDEQGELVPTEMQPTVRVLRGEVLKGPTAVDATIRALDGRVVQINISGAPLRDPHGIITGGVLVVRDVTARRRLERQRLLIEQTEARGREVALQEANRRMEEFLGMASHELRTPLTTIKANVQLAKRRLKTVSSEPVSEATGNKVDAAFEMLSRAERQIGVLNRLVSDLNDMSRIQTGKLQLHLRKEPSDLVQIISEVVQEQQKAFPQRTIRLSLPLSNEPLLMIADADRIAQVLINYLTNALKYSAADKPVVVRLKREKDTQGADIACLTVQDEGPGLSPEEQKRIWECFYQSEDVKVVSGSGVGLGLGLYISRTIIERHHGHTGVDSTPGVGSTFWFTLPLVQNNYIADKEEE